MSKADRIEVRFWIAIVVSEAMLAIMLMSNVYWLSVITWFIALLATAYYGIRRILI